MPAVTERAAKRPAGDESDCAVEVCADPLPEDTAAGWSSEGEEDRRHPDSLRTQLKRIFAEALSSEDGAVDTLCRKMARALRIRGARREPLLALPPSRSHVACEAAGTYCAAEETPDVPMPTRDARGPFLPAPEAPPLAPRVARSDSQTGFACRHCGHSFAMRRTRDMHTKVCGAG